jgi:uncharacterized protein (DUF2147 family)
MMRWIPFLVLATTVAGVPVLATDSLVGKWKTVDETTGKATSEVDVYEQGGKLFGKITGLTEPTKANGEPKTCSACSGADKDKPVVGLVILKDLSPKGDSYGGGTILDPNDGKVYKATVWVEDGKLKVRGHLGIFYRTQTWLKAS